MAKKIKLGFGEFIHFLDERKNSYYDSYRMALIKDDKKIYGTVYKLSNSLTDDDKTYILSWKNTRLFMSQAQYAPELKKNLVFIADKCL